MRAGGMDDLRGRMVLITGGASGIGLGMAQACRDAGLRVAIADVSPANLAAAAATLGPAVLPLRMDVTDADAWETTLDAAEKHFGALDILCNNAGVGQGRFADGRATDVAEMPEGLWRQVIEINLTGTFLGARAAARRMIARGQGGHIVNTASIGGLLAPGGIAAYCASKFAVVGLSESLRAELAPHGIGVSVLCPGGVRSQLFANSVARRAAAGGVSDLLATEATPALAIEQAQRMDPLQVGAHVLRAIRANHLYILTHPEYAPLLAERHAGLMACIGPSAQPGYTDTALTFERFTNPEYRRALGPLS